MHILTKWRIASSHKQLTYTYALGHGHGGGEKKIPSMGEAAVKVISVSSLIFALPQELRSIK